MKGEVTHDVAEGDEPHHHAGRPDPPLQGKHGGRRGVEGVDVEPSLLGDRLDGSLEDRDGGTREQPGRQRGPEEDVGGHRGGRQAEVRPGRTVLRLDLARLPGRQACQRKPVDQTDHTLGAQAVGIEGGDDALAAGVAPDVLDARLGAKEPLECLAVPLEEPGGLDPSPNAAGDRVDEPAAEGGRQARVGVGCAGRSLGVRLGRLRLRISQPQTSPRLPPARAPRVALWSDLNRPWRRHHLATSPARKPGCAPRHSTIAMQPEGAYTAPTLLRATKRM